jgi:hypothetical protein
VQTSDFGAWNPSGPAHKNGIPSKDSHSDDVIGRTEPITVNSSGIRVIFGS